LQAIERRHQAIVVVHGERFELVVVAAGAAQCQPEKSKRRRADDVVELIEAVLPRIGGLIVPRSEAIIAGGDQRVGIRIRQLIARELFDDEAVERLVIVERFYYIVAIAPDERPPRNALLTVWLRVTNDVEPMA